MNLSFLLPVVYFLLLFWNSKINSVCSSFIKLIFEFKLLYSLNSVTYPHCRVAPINEDEGRSAGPYPIGSTDSCEAHALLSQGVWLLT